MKMNKILISILLSMTLVSCATMKPQQEAAVKCGALGAVTGAASGALIGFLSGQGVKSIIVKTR